MRDAGVVDAGDVDAGEVDAGVEEDAGFDAGIDEDAGFDAGFVDAGEVDAGPEDAGAVDAGPCALPSGVGAPFTLRAMAANLSSGNLQTYDPGHGIRIIQGLRPDVVMIQEMNYAANDLAAFMAALDAGYGYARGTGQIPNGVLSRYPITDAGEWVDPRVTNRTFAWALVDLPGPRDLFVVSVHLLTTGGTERSLEAAALLAQLDANVSTRDLLLIGGDFNTDTAGEDALLTLAARAISGPPYPADQDGGMNTNAPRSKPYDHVLVSGCLAPAQADAGLVFDSRVYTPLTDVFPVQQTDSAAVGMQHMAVVKDFVLQP